MLKTRQSRYRHTAHLTLCKHTRNHVGSWQGSGVHSLDPGNLGMTLGGGRDPVGRYDERHIRLRLVHATTGIHIAIRPHHVGSTVRCFWLVEWHVDDRDILWEIDNDITDLAVPMISPDETTGPLTHQQDSLHSDSLQTIANDHYGRNACVLHASEDRGMWTTHADSFDDLFRLAGVLNNDGKVFALYLTLGDRPSARFFQDAPRAVDRGGRGWRMRAGRNGGIGARDKRRGESEVTGHAGTVRD